MDLSLLFAALWLSAFWYGVTINQDYMVAYLVVALLFLYSSQMFKLYRSWRPNRFSKMILTAWLNIAIGFIGLLFIAFILKQSETYSRVTISLWGILSLASSYLWRLSFFWYRKIRLAAGYQLKNVAIIGANKVGSDLRFQIEEDTDLGYNFMGFFEDRDRERIIEDSNIHIEGNINEAVLVARSGMIQVLFIVLPLKAEDRINDILLRLGDSTVDVHIVPNLLVNNLIHSRLGQIGEISTLSVFESPYHGANNWLKRTEDIVLSSIILSFISIPLLIIGLMVKLTSRGPILFKQKRYGLGGEEIKVWKFRSMKVHDEKSGAVVQATKGDSRVTRLGAFLRRTSLDELPQFINVLTGGMSIVGPRPHAVSHNEEYRGKIDFYMLRHKVKPGITGWAQINGWRGETDTLEKMEKRVEYDLAYIRNWSLLFDIKIIFLTIFKGFIGKNAY